MGNRQQAAGNRQQAAGNGQSAIGNSEQPICNVRNRQQAANQRVLCLQFLFAAVSTGKNLNRTGNRRMASN
jgi:hypothetical protein